MNKNSHMFKKLANIPSDKESKDNSRDYQELCLSIFESMPTTFNVLNSRLEIVMCNEYTYKFFGCERQEEYKEKISELSPIYQPDGTLSEIGLAQYLGDAYRDGSKVFDWTHCDISGNPIPCTVTLVKLDIIDEYGGYLVIGHLKDKRPELLIKEHESQFNKNLKAILDVTPLCLNIWTSDLEGIMCNKKAYELYDLDNEEQYLAEFFNLSPTYQPNGRKSEDLILENLKKAFATGYCQFKWLHINLRGDEIPCEITLVKIEGYGDTSEDLLAGFSRDLRDSLPGSVQEIENQYEIYFLNHISDKVLFNAVTDLSDELFFALDIRTSLIQYFGKKSSVLSPNKNRTLFPNVIISENRICSEDVPLLHDILDNVHKGIFEPIDIRLKGNNDTPHFYRIIYQIIFGNNNEPIFAVGKAVDIQEQKELEVKATTDLLTSCYNKITTEAKIANLFTSSKIDQEHVLFIVDIDDFKEVNDNLGHHFGDLVLTEVANKLKSQFRNQDIVGRIGGDEFMVLVKDIADINIVIKKAEDIATSFNHTYSGENTKYIISASIGIARFPLDGITYNELYKAADKALYESKRKGKNCYTFYSDKLFDGTMKNLTVYENAYKKAETYFDTELISTVFDILYASSDIRLGINIVLQHLGERLKVGRSYIFETFDGGNTYSNTYEWCNINITPEISNLQGISKEVLVDFFVDANKDGIIYSNDLTILTAEGAYSLMAQQDIKSFLHAQTRNGGFVKEFLGVDDCSEPRMWREKEINSILYVKKLMSSFLMIENSN